MCVHVFFCPESRDWGRKCDKTQSYIFYGRRRNPVNTNTAEHFLLLTTLRSPLNALCRIAITCHFPLSYTQNHRHTAVALSSKKPITENLERIRVLVRHVKTDSPEPKRSVYIQNRCVAGQLGRNRPSTFSLLPSQLPSLPCSGSLWAGRESSFGRTFFFIPFPPAREDWLAFKTASI